MNPLVLIPARAGSKSVPGKNYKKLNGKPLIQYTIEAARAVFSDSNICISTDDLNIIELCKNIDLMVPFTRPTNLATDTSSTHEVILHAIDFYSSKGQIFDTIVLLQPTSPFRNKTHISEAINLFNFDLDMVVSVKESHANPYFNLFEEQTNGFLKKVNEGIYTRRQDCPKTYEYNGAIYVINVDSIRKGSLSSFQKVKKYIMSELDSIDIDTPLDWEIANLISQKNI
jgi:N-acylneuraminate cytidylyltransferase